jgi:hypothetical protein
MHENSGIQAKILAKSLSQIIRIFYFENQDSRNMYFNSVFLPVNFVKLGITVEIPNRGTIARLASAYKNTIDQKYLVSNINIYIIYKQLYRQR